jgi:hypothetical protein
VIVTPVSVYSVVDPLTRTLEESDRSLWSEFGASLRNTASPLTLALCNTVIIPFLVDIVAMY